MTLETPPPGATHWSSRAMAKAVSHAPSTIHRIWRAFCLQPHRTETFKLSTDPRFVEKVRDIIGLYMAPPERAMVLCVDEKSQIQALDRTQPLLPMRPGQVERRTTIISGTASPLSRGQALVTVRCPGRRHRQDHRQMLSRSSRPGVPRLPHTVKARVPSDLDINIVMDNASTHKTRAVRNWFAKRPRWQVHYTPTSASWINQVERFFANLTEKQIRRGAHRSTAELEGAIAGYIEAVNADPKPSSGPNPPTISSPPSSASASPPSKPPKSKR